MSGRGRRQEWQLRAASSPAKPVALDGRSARGLLSMLEGRDEPGCVEAYEALTNALAGGGPEAIREAMDAARRVLPAPAIPPAEARAAELAQTFAENELLGLPSAYDETPQGPDPADVLARLDVLLSGELSRSQRWNLEQHRRELARVMGNGAKSLAGHARRAAEALDAHGAEVERRRVSAAKRQRTLAGKAPAAGTADAVRAVRPRTDDTHDGGDVPPDPSPEAA